MTRFAKYTTPIALIMLPMLLHAETIMSTLAKFEDILRRIVPILMVLATVVFLYGVIRYVTAGGDSDKISEGRNYMIYGLIALFVMVAAWGIVAILVDSFGVGGGTIPIGPGDIE